MRVAWRVVLSAASIAFALAFAASASGQSELTPEAVAQQVAERYGVEVLRVGDGDGPSGPVYIVTVMNPGGDYNGAFQVTRLMVDRVTGELVSQFRHEATGYELPGGGGNAIRGASGPAIRRMSHPQGTGQGGG